MQKYAEKIYVLVHRCHEQCLKLMRASNSSKDELNEIGINTRQGIILKYLFDEDGLTQREITKRLEITSSSSGELISKLEQAGFLEKRKNLNDKRTFNLYLTEKGHTQAKEYKESAVIELEAWATELTQDEKEQLFHLLGKLSNGLEKQIIQRQMEKF